MSPDLQSIAISMTLPITLLLAHLQAVYSPMFRGEELPPTSGSIQAWVLQLISSSSLGLKIKVQSALAWFCLSSHHGKYPNNLESSCFGQFSDCHLPHATENFCNFLNMAVAKYFSDATVEIHQASSLRPASVKYRHRHYNNYVRLWIFVWCIDPDIWT